MNYEQLHPRIRLAKHMHLLSLRHIPCTPNEPAVSLPSQLACCLQIANGKHTLPPPTSGSLLF